MVFGPSLVSRRRGRGCVRVTLSGRGRPLFLDRRPDVADGCKYQHNNRGSKIEGIEIDALSVDWLRCQADECREACPLKEKAGLAKRHDDDGNDKPGKRVG